MADTTMMLDAVPNYDLPSFVDTWAGRLSTTGLAMGSLRPSGSSMGSLHPNCMKAHVMLAILKPVALDTAIHQCKLHCFHEVVLCHAHGCIKDAD